MIPRILRGFPGPGEASGLPRLLPSDSRHPFQSLALWLWPLHWSVDGGRQRGANERFWESSHTGSIEPVYAGFLSQFNDP